MSAVPRPAWWPRSSSIPASKVAAGDPLVRLDSSKEEADLKATQAQIPAAKADLDRKARLVKERVVSQSDLDDAQSRYDELSAQSISLKATIDRRLLTAPFGGVLGIRKVNKGQYLQPGDQIVSLQDLSVMRMRFLVGQKDYAKIKLGQDIEARFDAYPGEVFKGRITAIEPSVKFQSGIIPIQAEIPNSDARLLPGMYGSLDVLLPDHSNKLVVPQSAVAFNLYGESIYVVDEQAMTVQQATVTTGARRGNLVVDRNRTQARTESGGRRPAQAVERHQGQCRRRPDAPRDDGRAPAIARGRSLRCASRTSSSSGRSSRLPSICCCVIAGFAALASLQIRQFPQMQFTVITVTTVYTGASADLVQGFVTQPLQEQIAAADGVDYLTSESRASNSVITVYMRLNYAASAAQANILAKIQAVRADLPKEIEDPKLDISTGDITQLIYFSLSSDTLNSAQITDYAKRVIQPKFSTVPGVSKIRYYGDREFAMRIWLDPRKLAVYEITAADVRNAIANNNYQTTAGQVRGQYNSFDIDAKTGLERPEDFGAIIVASTQKGIVRLRDVADVSLGAKEADVVAKQQGKPAVFIGIDYTPTANPLEVAGGLKALIPEIERNLPVGMTMRTAYDSSIFIEESIKEVEHTIVEAAVIVTVVIFLFIGSLRAIIIPIIALPLSIVGVAMFLAALGFSINLLTLLAIVLAIGLVVDDAIVVLENVDRHMKEGKSAFLAAIVGTREIAVPVISMTITLAAVYAPIAFTPGISGALFSEFALTLAGAVFISGFVALTLSPVMCAMILKSSGQPSRVQKFIEHNLERMDRGYHGLLDRVLHVRIVGHDRCGVGVRQPLSVVRRDQQRASALGGPGRDHGPDDRAHRSQCGLSGILP